MLQGIYYMLGLIAIGLVIRWFVQNDGIGPGERTTGLFRMERGGEQKPSNAQTRRGGAAGR